MLSRAIVIRMIKFSSHSSKAQSGNVLWFILIAVVLLAALTLMLTRSSSSVDQSGNFEQQRVKASQLMRYASGVEQAIDKLRTINNCSENDISFENTIDLDYNNTSSPADNSCHLFEPEGAGLSWRTFSDNTLNDANNPIAFVNDFLVKGVGPDDTNRTGNDLIFAARVSENLCDHINAQLGIATADAGITVVYEDWDNPYDGAFIGATAVVPDNGGTALDGQATGCLIDVNGHFVFYHTVLAR